MNVTQIERQDEIGILRFDRPDVLNAINEQMVGEIEGALDQFEADKSISAIAMIGTGRAFCAGSDLKEGGGDPEGRIARMHRLMLRLIAFPKVSVALFNGLALGGGLEIGLACTFRLAAPAARLGLPEVTHALMPACGGTQLLPRIVGVPRALELALSGELIDAARAEQIGLVNAVADDLLAAGMQFARHKCGGGGVAQREIRRAVLGGFGLPLSQGLALEAEGASRVAASEEARRAIAAFANR